MRKQNKFFKNEVGKKYNRLLVIEKSINDKYGNTKWKCKCDCGNIVEVIGTSLRNGSTKSCGCLLKDAMFKRRTGNSVYNIILNNIKSDCKNRKIPFNLSLKDIKEISILPCTYCKREPYELKCRYQKPNSSAKNECLLLNGIDRIEPDKGYIKENITSCCKYCNRAKSDLSIEKFKELIELIYKNYIK